MEFTVGELNAIKRAIVRFIGGPTRVHYSDGGAKQDVVAFDHQYVVHAGEDVTYLVTALEKLERY